MTIEACDAVESLTVTSGEVWLTRTSDTVDYCLSPGERIVAVKGEKLIVEALRKASLSVSFKDSRTSLRISAAWSRRPT